MNGTKFILALGCLLGCVLQPSSISFPGERNLRSPTDGNSQTPGSLYGTDSIVGRLLFVPAGTFLQGTPDTENCHLPSESPQFQHELTANLAVMETEVTRQMWAGLKAAQPDLPADPSEAAHTLSRPANLVSFHQTILFANLLSVQQGLTRAYYKDAAFSQPVDKTNFESTPLYCDFNADGFRLPTEGEWEYFARAGTTGLLSVEDPTFTAPKCGTCTAGLLPVLESVAWYCPNSGNDVQPVGSKAANPWGLKDVHGNVWEWCWDFYTSYPLTSQKDYRGGASGYRVLRGGSYLNHSSDQRSGARWSMNPSYGVSGTHVGFRLVRPARASRQAALKFTEVWPDQGMNDLPNDITLIGEGFTSGSVVTMGLSAGVRLHNPPAQPAGRHGAGLISPLGAAAEMTLASELVSATELRATVPDALTPGTYYLAVTGTDSRKITLSAAYTVLDSMSPLDDLYGESYEIWTIPSPPRAGSAAAIGLLVHRNGGKNPLSEISVRFFQGDCSTGSLIGNSRIMVMSPDSAANTPAPPDPDAVLWTPPATGPATLCAMIDPLSTISETREDNNRVRRDLNVLTAYEDKLSPHVDSFTIQNGDPLTTNQNIRLSATASDPPTASGLASVFYQEFEFNQSVRSWIPVQQSGWLSFADNSANYEWRLVPFVGVHFLQAWAMDRAGNISVFPYKGYINFLPPSDSIRRQQVRIYRRSLVNGQTFTVTLYPLAGDPDLYIWPPSGSPPWVSNLADDIDQYVLAITATGTYQVEVHGNTAAQYRLTMEIQDARLQKMSLPWGGIDPDKEILAAAAIPPDREPDVLIAVPVANLRQIFLPLILK